jgi:hypothetical protein
MKFTNAIADAICERIAVGESLRTICKADNMPAQSSVFKWLANEPGFAEQYARARETQADAIFDEILNIADDSDGDVQRDRLRVDSRKWMAGKLRPKKYGDKMDVEHTGVVELNVTYGGS